VLVPVERLDHPRVADRHHRLAELGEVGIVRAHQFHQVPAVVGESPQRLEVNALDHTWYDSGRRCVGSSHSSKRSTTWTVCSGCSSRSRKASAARSNGNYCVMSGLRSSFACWWSSIIVRSSRGTSHRYERAGFTAKICEQTMLI